MKLYEALENTNVANIDSIRNTSLKARFVYWIFEQLKKCYPTLDEQIQIRSTIYKLDKKMFILEYKDSELTKIQILSILKELNL